jgi:hypothetical protein
MHDANGEGGYRWVTGDFVPSTWLRHRSGSVADGARMRQPVGEPERLNTIFHIVGARKAEPKRSTERLVPSTVAWSTCKVARVISRLQRQASPSVMSRAFAAERAENVLHAVGSRRSSPCRRAARVGSARVHHVERLDAEKDERPLVELLRPACNRVADSSVAGAASLGFHSG